MYCYNCCNNKYVEPYIFGPFVGSAKKGYNTVSNAVSSVYDYAKKGTQNIVCPVCPVCPVCKDKELQTEINKLQAELNLLRNAQKKNLLNLLLIIELEIELEYK